MIDSEKSSKWINISKFQSSSSDSSPASRAEKNIVFASKQTPIGKKLYDRVYDDLLVFSMKSPDSIARKCVEMLLKRGLIYIGRNMSSIKTGVVGTVLIKNDKLCGIIIDAVELDIDPFTGETSNIDAVFYAVYFEFIRAVVIIHSGDIYRNSKIHILMKKYLAQLLLKVISSGVNLNDKQKIFLDSVCSYFYHRFMLKETHEQSREAVLSQYKKSDNIVKEIDFILPRLVKYENMRDLFKGLVDFNIVNESPSVLIMKCLTKFKTFAFYSFTTSLDYLIALAITSKYPVSFLSGAMINSDIQDQLENIMSKLYWEVKFDVNYLSKL